MRRLHLIMCIGVLIIIASAVGCMRPDTVEGFASRPNGFGYVIDERYFGTRYRKRVYTTWAYNSRTGSRDYFPYRKNETVHNYEYHFRSWRIPNHNLRMYVHDPKRKVYTKYHPDKHLHDIMQILATNRLSIRFLNFRQDEHIPFRIDELSMFKRAYPSETIRITVEQYVDTNKWSNARHDTRLGTHVSTYAKQLRWRFRMETFRNEQVFMYVFHKHTNTYVLEPPNALMIDVFFKMYPINLSTLQNHRLIVVPIIMLPNEHKPKTISRNELQSLVDKNLARRKEEARIRSFNNLPTKDISYLEKKTNKKVTFDGNVRLYEYDANDVPKYYDTNVEGVALQANPFVSSDDTDNIVVGDSNVDTTFRNSKTNFKKPVTITNEHATINKGRFHDLAHFNDIRANGNICFYDQSKFNCISKSDVEQLSDTDAINEQLGKIRSIRGACTSESMLTTNSELDNSFSLTDDMICKDEKSGVRKFSNWYDENAE